MHIHSNNHYGVTLLLLEIIEYPVCNIVSSYLKTEWISVLHIIYMLKPHKWKITCVMLDDDISDNGKSIHYNIMCSWYYTGYSCYCLI